jgi:DNA-binding transcriptional LysR family regulator
VFTLTQLRGFIAVAEELHFGRAAERLRMTQPPLSRQIHLLERDLQVRLFDRTGRSVRLTPAGRAFLGEARRLLRQAEHAALSTRRVAEGRAGRLRIGFTAISAHDTLGTLLATARRELPGVDVTLREMVTRDQLEALAGDALDLGLVRPPIADPELCTRTLTREPLVAALPEDHPLAARTGPLPVRAFDGEPLIMYEPVGARYFHELLIGIFRAARVAPAYAQYMTQAHSMLALVSHGWGVAFIPASVTRLHYAGVAFRPLDLPDPEPVELLGAWRKANDNPALALLLAHL